MRECERRINYPDILTCRHCGKTDTKEIFRTLKVCKECRHNQQVESRKKRPGYRDWQQHIDNIQIYSISRRTCYKCHIEKDSSEFKSRKTCKKCYSILQSKYRISKSHPKGKYISLAFSAKRRGILCLITLDEFIHWWNTQIKECLYCGKTQQEVKESKDRLDILSPNFSIDRMDNNQGYNLGNIALCCRRCNTIKGDFFTKDEMIEIGNIIKRRNE